MKHAVVNLDSKKSGDIELDDAVFGITEIRGDILQRMVRYQLAKRQAGTHSTLSRSNVSVTTKKFGRQKGGGTARHGSRNAPIFVGGGTAHGPHPHSHAHDLPKKVRALAMKHALSSKLKDERLVVLDKASSSGKTRQLRSQLTKLGIDNALVIGGTQLDGDFAKAARNIPNIDVLPLAGLNVYDVLRHDTLVLTKEAVDGVHARFAVKGAIKGAKAGDPEFVDEVVLIDGVGDKSAKALKKEGFGTLTALAAASESDAKAVFKKISKVDRAAHEDWHGQAKAQVAGAAPRAKVDQRLLEQKRQKGARREGGSNAISSDASIRTSRENDSLDFSSLGEKNQRKKPRALRHPERIALRPSATSAEPRFSGKTPVLEVLEAVMSIRADDAVDAASKLEIAAARLHERLQLSGVELDADQRVLDKVARSVLRLVFGAPDELRGAAAKLLVEVSVAMGLSASKDNEVQKLVAILKGYGVNALVDVSTREEAAGYPVLAVSFNHDVAQLLGITDAPTPTATLSGFDPGTEVEAIVVDAEGVRIGRGECRVGTGSRAANITIPLDTGAHTAALLVVAVGGERPWSVPLKVAD